MKKNGLNQSAMAKLIGVSQPTVFHWVNGQKWPSRENLIRLSNVTGISIDELLERKAA